jgi:hypothetical protein
MITTNNIQINLYSNNRDIKWNNKKKYKNNIIQ